MTEIMPLQKVQAGAEAQEYRIAQGGTKIGGSARAIVRQKYDLSRINQNA